jgi:hypothetical protein
MSLIGIIFAIIGFMLVMIGFVAFKLIRRLIELEREIRGEDAYDRQEDYE